MALTSKNIALAQDFIDLKKRVNAMIDKRKHEASNRLDQKYGTGSNYEYNNEDTPIPTRLMKTGSINKIIEPMDAISQTVVNNEMQYDSLGIQYAGDIIKSVDVVDLKLSVHEYFSNNQYGIGTDCKTNCAGLCHRGCSGTCVGSCTGTCSGDCDAHCADDCSTSCNDTCDGKCTGWCSSGCSTNCARTCYDTCSKNCVGGNNNNSDNYAP